MFKNYRKKSKKSKPEKPTSVQLPSTESPAEQEVSVTELEASITEEEASVTEQPAPKQVKYINGNEDIVEEEYEEAVGSYKKSTRSKRGKINQS